MSGICVQSSCVICVLTPTPRVDVMVQVQEATGKWTAAYFYLLIFIGSFFLLVSF